MGNFWGNVDWRKLWRYLLPRNFGAWYAPYMNFVIWIISFQAA
ncbi:hypothetical protein [Alysiella crassa]